MAFLIKEALSNGTKFQEVDSYYILNVATNGSFDAQIKWGVAGFETDPVFVSGLTPINPSDPDLRTVPVVVDLSVHDGFYDFGGAENRVHRDSFVYNGNSYEVISSNETIHDRDHPQLIYYHATYYYEQMTGILLHSSYGYGPPDFEVGTVDLIATNAFPLNSGRAHNAVSVVQIAILLSVTLFSLLLAFPLTKRLARSRAVRNRRRHRRK